MKDFDMKLEQKWVVHRYKKYHNLSYLTLRTKMNNSKRNPEESLIIVIRKTST